MPKIRYSAIALRELRSINDYIADNWGEDTAKSILRKITSSIDELEQHPALGASLGKLIGVPTDYRYLFIEKNYVFYRMEIDEIHIIRILNERQDFMQQLFGISIDPNED